MQLSSTCTCSHFIVQFMLWNVCDNLHCYCVLMYVYICLCVVYIILYSMYRLKFGEVPAVESVYLCCIISLLSHTHPSSLGVITGVAVGCLSLSLLLTAATNVITFLCTRRCYNKKSSPPSPNEKSVYYETVQSDSVPMQPSPAYQSVEQVKWPFCNDISFISFAHSHVTIVVYLCSMFDSSSFQCGTCLLLIRA